MFVVHKSELDFIGVSCEVEKYRSQAGGVPIFTDLETVTKFP